MDKIEQFFLDKIEKEQTLIFKFIQNVFNKDNELYPLLLSINFKDLTSPYENNLISLNQVFSLDKDKRNNAFAFLINKLKPMICILVNEAWMLKINKNGNLNQMPSESEDREECLIINIMSPFQHKLITIPINSDFLKINNGNPQKSLDLANKTVVIGNDIETVFFNIYKDYGPKKEDIVKLLSK